MIKPTFNIIVTDLTRIEWLATLFQNSIVGSSCRNRVKVNVKWRRKPSWAHDPTLPLGFPRYELESSILNLYSFPSAIKRDFLLDDLDIEFDGALLIVDLGNKKLWQRHINHSHLPVEVWDDKLLNSIEEHLDQVGNDDLSKIWGVELLNQIKGAKLVLGIKSSSDCVPSSYIREHLPLRPSFNIVLQDVDPDSWHDHYDSFSPNVVVNTLSKLEQMLVVVDGPERPNSVHL